MRPETPRGIRNFNPGNIRHAKGVRWQGMAVAQGDTAFVQFTAPRWGIRAIARVLITYQDKRLAADGSRIDTVREFIERWAPPSENNTNAYTASVARALGLHPDYEGVDVYDFDVMRTLVSAIVRHENGPGPLPGGHWYGDAIIADGLALAGIELGAKHGVAA
ncbi:structural protein [Pseudomonas gessardii]|uniref:Structural protein n=1 Tax=Pseudomonas gessardii TaxID=78544 RepID=A0ABS9FDL5_9PSED|nr:structural protein [Pseudomonas gessardii]MCF4982094.1 structural protein [Pseudomonas gessardii]MCF4993839.1 structural protein [Pseudomonas gessardii]MCF5087652.1 structural protein [Pseudomonas gessardii]MCF5098042.1 structural protein [Pseudomonas gessardii]MCF5110415.1 structural protein [Pseudomonas gessardii]